MDLPFESVEQDVQLKDKNKSQKAQKEFEQQLKKKLSNAVSAITKVEKKPFDHIISQTPTKNILAFHFGMGEETDYITLQNYLQQYGPSQIQLFPVKNYAFVQFQSQDQAIQLLQNQTQFENINYSMLNYQNKPRPTFFYFSKLESCKSNVNDIPNAKFDSKIPGLTLIKDFLSEEEEQQIMEFVDKQEWESMNQRRVQHYGFDFLYGVNTIDVKEPSQKKIPEQLTPIQDRVSNLFKDKQKPVDQLTINEYEPGMGIPPHFDVHPPFMEYFVSISLLSGLVMSFKSYKGDEEHLYLPPRSCALFSGEVRFAWFHSIASRKMDRVEDQMYFRRRRLSLTFRTIRQDLNCKCVYPFYCESQGFDPIKMKVHNPLLDEYMKKHHRQVQDNEKGNKKVPQKSEDEWKMMQQVENLEISKPTEIEQKYVYDIYDKIAPHFSHTRYKPWPKIEKFLNDLERGSLVADVGCGNGKYLGVNKENIQMIGSDRSENLLKICREKDKDYQVFSADCLKLPFRNNLFDAAISIAVIHHFSNKALRKVAIQEMLRIVRSKGLLLIYVWAFEQEEKEFSEQDSFVPWNLQFKYENNKEVIDEEKKDEKMGMEQKQGGLDDYEVNKDKKTIVYKRYYHVFKKGELEELLSEMKGFAIVNEYYDHANWVVVLQKD